MEADKRDHKDIAGDEAVAQEDQPRKRRRTRFSDVVPAGSEVAVDPDEASKKAREQVRKINEKLAPESSSSAGQAGTGGAGMGSALKGADAFSLLSARIGVALGKAQPPPQQMSFQNIAVTPVTSLKVNQNQRRQEKLKRALKLEKGDFLETDPSKNQYFDPRLKPLSGNRASRRSFNFVEQGKYITQAEKQREKAELQRIQEELRQKEKAAANTPQALLLKVEEADELPEIEWWDAPFLENGTYENLEEGIHRDKVTAFIHHPIPIEVDEGETPAIPLMLTKKERKRMRHQRRMEVQKDRTQQIQMNLIPPPPPKVKLSNMMRVLATQISQDPTKVEAEVRRQVLERQQAHEAQNEARKPTKEEKEKKLAEKVEKEKAKGMHACVFRILDLANPQHRFKINVNAEQNHLTGCAIYNESCNIVVVEGSFKSLQKFKKLMLRRIDWNAEITSQEDGPDSMVQDQPSEGKKENRCVLVWEGEVAKAGFKRFMATPIPTQEDVRKVFRFRRVEHYWDTALTFPIHDEMLGNAEV